MSGKTQDVLRAWLLAHPEGLTRKQITDQFPHYRSRLHRTLKNMPDVYIDRWEDTPGARGPRYVQVLCAVPTPKDCPKPERTNA